MEISQLYQLFQKHPVVTTDSRDCPTGSLFFALKGEHFNGNLYVAKALDAGCAYAIVDEADVIPADDERYILVNDVLTSLQDLAHEHRSHFPHPVLQITGTNGKTTTKELTAAVLSQRYQTLATEANYNNHIGVPKTLLRLNGLHKMAVIETGANHPGEIADLSRIVDPDYGLITNVGRAHLEGFGSFEGVIQTKAELYDYLRTKAQGTVFLHADNPYLSPLTEGLTVVSYGEPGGKGCLVEGEVVECNPYLVVRWRRQGCDEWQQVTTHLIGRYNLSNVLAAICVGVYFDLEEPEINFALATYQPKNDRSELRQTAHNRLIVDAYNANPTSMAAALSNFAAMKAPHKMVIIGDMAELGEASADEHRKVVEQLQADSSLEEVWLVGKRFQAVNTGFRTFNKVEEVYEALLQTPLEGRLILIKGSNSTRLYTLPERL